MSVVYYGYKVHVTKFVSVVCIENKLHTTKCVSVVYYWYEVLIAKCVCCVLQIKGSYKGMCVCCALLVYKVHLTNVCLLCITDIGFIYNNNARFSTNIPLFFYFY